MNATDEESESDIELPTAMLPNQKFVKIAPKSPTAEILSPKKVTTKTMVQQALVDLKSRKGASLYAIKKYIEENFKMKTEKINFFIKKYIKSGVEAGTIIQTKGVGVTGSFKLAAVKPEKKKKVSKPVKEKAPKEKPAKDKDTKEKPAKKKTEKESQTKENVKKPKKIQKKMKEDKENSPPTLIKVMKKKKIGKEDTKKTTKSKSNAKTAKDGKTPSKKKVAMMKRKSIGTIIKPPKMKPKLKP